MCVHGYCVSALVAACVCTWVGVRQLRKVPACVRVRLCVCVHYTEEGEGDLPGSFFFPKSLSLLVSISKPLSLSPANSLSLTRSLSLSTYI